MAISLFKTQIIGRSVARLDDDEERKRRRSGGRSGGATHGSAASRVMGAGSGGRSAVAAAAYRHGENLHDDRTGNVHDFTRRDKIVHSEIMAPSYAPPRLLDRQTLWNEVEGAEKRCDAQLSREIVLAIPHELKPEARVELVREFVQSQFVDRGMIADVAIHEPGWKSDSRNVHAHIMLTTREVDAQGFGKKNRDWNERALQAEWRHGWGDRVNKALEREGFGERIDTRSRAERETDLTAKAQSHQNSQIVRLAAVGTLECSQIGREGLTTLPRSAWHMEQRGEPTEAAQKREQTVLMQNQVIAGALADIRAIEATQKAAEVDKYKKPTESKEIQSRPAGERPKPAEEPKTEPVQPSKVLLQQEAEIITRWHLVSDQKAGKFAPTHQIQQVRDDYEAWSQQAAKVFPERQAGYDNLAKMDKCLRQIQEDRLVKAKILWTAQGNLARENLQLLDYSNRQDRARGEMSEALQQRQDYAKAHPFEVKMHNLGVKASTKLTKIDNDVKMHQQEIHKFADEIEQIKASRFNQNQVGQARHRFDQTLTLQPGQNLSVERERELQTLSQFAQLKATEAQARELIKGQEQLERETKAAQIEAREVRNNPNMPVTPEPTESQRMTALREEYNRLQAETDPDKRASPLVFAKLEEAMKSPEDKERERQERDHGWDR